MENIEYEKTSRVVSDLESIIRTTPHPSNLQARVEFSFLPTAVGGNEGRPWQALLIRPPLTICDYGWTFEEAAARILDRFQNPEKYPDLEDD